MIRTISATNDEISVKQDESHYIEVTCEKKSKIEEIFSGKMPGNFTRNQPEAPKKLPNEKKLQT